MTKHKNIQKCTMCKKKFEDKSLLEDYMKKIIIMVVLMSARIAMMINRPGVAGAVLQSCPSFID